MAQRQGNVLCTEGDRRFKRMKGRRGEWEKGRVGEREIGMK